MCDQNSSDPLRHGRHKTSEGALWYQQGLHTSHTSSVLNADYKKKIYCVPNSSNRHFFLAVHAVKCHDGITVVHVQSAEMHLPMMLVTCK